MKPAKPTYVVRTLGCKANLADSQRIEAELQARGFEAWSKSSAGSANVCVINSCTVTDEADRQTRKLAARLSREHPGTAVVVTGCAAEVDPERLAHSKGIRYIVGNRDKPRLVELILEELNRSPNQPVVSEEGRVLGKGEGYATMASRHPMDREWPVATDAVGGPIVSLDGDSAKTRLFLKIQEGCNSFCTYCVIPYGRGPSRSIAPEQIIGSVKEVVSSGVREIVLTGTNIGDYGTDWAGESRLEELLRRVLGETGLERLRVSSLDPTEITPEMISLMSEDSRFCPHFHVSLQSASDRVLRLMKRKYAVSDIVRCFERISSVRTDVVGGVFVGMDVIAGFPGETEAEFEKGLGLLKALPWTRLHVFPYSERDGTPATRLPDGVPVPERQRRSKFLNELSATRLAQWHAAIQKQCSSGSALTGILLERSGFRPPNATRSAINETWFAGYTSNYVRVAVPAGPEVRENSFATLRPHKLITESTGGGEAVFLADFVGQ